MSLLFQVLPLNFSQMINLKLTEVKQLAEGYMHCKQFISEPSLFLFKAHKALSSTAYCIL